MGVGDEQKIEDVVIVGAGVAGLATALALKRVGVRAIVLERSHELRTTGAHLSLFPNAWTALRALGIDHKLTSIYQPFKKGYVTDLEKGSKQALSFTRSIGERINNATGARSVHRKTLLETLANELPTDAIRFSIKIKSIETHTIEGSALVPVLHLDDGSTIIAKVLIGCDGINSIVATWLGLSKPIHSGRYAVRGLSVVPQGHGLNNEAHQFISNQRRAGAVHLTDTEVAWFITYPSTASEDEEMKSSGDPKWIQQKVMEYISYFPPMLSEFVQQSDLKTLSLAPLKFRKPWDLVFNNICKGNVTVAGDAFHPMTPDLAQGGCSALEDAVVLGRHIGNSFLKHNKIVATEVSEALKLYVKERKWRAIGLIVGAYFSGRVQQGGSGWLNFVRNVLFYRFIFRRLIEVAEYDCGKLPSAASFKQLDDNHSKVE
ncbi:hypothetical protein Scep_002348 [Stephania cephalantha]|uniref:FAD-binding domain-containing protein n=1 Tax=Stephania cephalantha TaxID=152367 RepID=A0AAP0L9R9_9MAGN